MRCTSGCTATARYLVNAGDTVLLLLCPACWRRSRETYDRADGRPLRRGA